MEDAALTAALAKPDAYPHPVDGVRVIETHISRVFLAGDFAYKVRKPVRFDFVDFSTAQARSEDCQTELRLNRPLAPGLYLDVVPIVAGDTAGSVKVEGTGITVEYAVKMRRFAQQDLFIEMLTANRLKVSHIDALAVRLARFHGDQPCAQLEEGYGTPARVRATLDESLGGIGRLDDRSGLLTELSRLVRARAAALGEAIQSRLQSGHVRECMATSTWATSYGWRTSRRHSIAWSSIRACAGSTPSVTLPFLSWTCSITGGRTWPTVC